MLLNHPYFFNCLDNRVVSVLPIEERLENVDV